MRFRSAPPHGGRPGWPQQDYDSVPQVSIRAPARGATLGTPVETVTEAVSIRAPARGATCGSACWPSCTRLFRSAPPHGGRRRWPVKWCSGSSFDPRPRTGGDALRARGCSRFFCFDPRPRTGGDVSLDGAYTDKTVFRSAPPHGGRPLGSGKARVFTQVSIRAPARGATALARQRSSRPPVSIRAPARGATLARRRSTVHQARFDPRPRTGGDVR